MKYPYFGIAALLAGFTLVASPSDGATKKPKAKPHVAAKKKSVKKPQQKPTPKAKPLPKATALPKPTVAPRPTPHPQPTAQPKPAVTPQATPPLPIVAQPLPGDNGKLTGHPHMGVMPRTRGFPTPRRTRAVPDNPGALAVGAKAAP